MALRVSRFWRRTGSTPIAVPSACTGRWRSCQNRVVADWSPEVHHQLFPTLVGSMDSLRGRQLGNDVGDLFNLDRAAVLHIRPGPFLVFGQAFHQEYLLAVFQRE